MTDRERAVVGVECCLDCYEPQCDVCPYKATKEDRKKLDWDCHKDELRRDLLELLKAQEPVKPIKPRGSVSWICGACKIAIGTGLILYHFCPWCGKAVERE